MRIVIDMQGAQTESRFRGIGRYTLSFAQAVARNRGEHEILLALNGLFPETIEAIRSAFDGLLPRENVRVWQTPGPAVLKQLCGNDEQALTMSALFREKFLQELDADIIHVSSLFEGYGDQAVTSIKTLQSTAPVSVSLYDLIPLLRPEAYLNSNPPFERFYRGKIRELERADTFLAISEFCRQEGVKSLGLEEESVVNVSGAIDSSFRRLQITEEEAHALCQKFDISGEFVLYTGGVDERKNLARLIQAFASLPKAIRQGRQLVLAGKIPPGNLHQLKHQAKAAGVCRNDIVFTGYVSDDELVKLYNLCRVYVFPSWHEGLGLPALEAMACGAPVIAANASSLPEIVDYPDALFDPFEVNSISAKLRCALEDEEFRDKLRAHGLSRARTFSWDETARRAIRAWFERHGDQTKAQEYPGPTLSRKRFMRALGDQVNHPGTRGLASVAACVGANDNAADRRQLLVDVSELCQSDAGTGVQRVVKNYLRELLQSPPRGFSVEPVYASLDSGYRYARCFTQVFLGCQEADLDDEPIQWQRGDIFFGLDMQHHVQLTHEAFFRRLRADGVTVKFLVYDLLPIQLAASFDNDGARELHERLLAMIARTDGAVCISRATADAYREWMHENRIESTPNFQLDWVHIGVDDKNFSASSGLPDNALQVLASLKERPTFLCVSTVEPRKRQAQVLGAVEKLWAKGYGINLVLVGRLGWKVEEFARVLENHPEKDKRLFWLRGISDQYLEEIYRASSCLVAASANEGFGLPLIEAARFDIPIVARDIGVFREVAGDAAYYFQGMAPDDLADSLAAWLGLFERGKHPLPNEMRWLSWSESKENLQQALIDRHYAKKQLLVDVSELAQRDAKTGIQRVVRNVIREWLANPPEGYRVEPVYATPQQEYRYAHRFTRNFLGKVEDKELTDQPIDYAPGDIFFGLDMQPQTVISHRKFYRHLRLQGISVRFMVYDLLAVQMPQHFLPGTEEGFKAWLEVVAESDGAVCISRTVADDFRQWLHEHAPERSGPFAIDWFHMGADIESSDAIGELPESAAQVLGAMRERPSFVMVGTIEPRKGYAQVVEAFDELWEAGVELGLVLVGKRGWMVDSLIERIENHEELNKRLFWVDNANDAYLSRIYEAGSCLIAASEGEGFGLPLIEAAQHGLPIIARDIPVFREVAGESAFYFTGNEPKGLASAVERWLAGRADGGVPMPGVNWLAWEKSTRNLLHHLTDAARPQIVAACTGLAANQPSRQSPSKGT